MYRCQSLAFYSHGQRFRRRLPSPRRHALEGLESRHLLAAAPIAVDDSFTVAEDGVLFADDPTSSWTVAVQQAAPMHWWDFEETSGGILSDSGSAGIGATLGGGVVLNQAGLVGKSAYFNSTGFARIGAAQLTADWTVETIARIDVAAAFAHSLLGASQEEMAAGRGISLRLGQAPRLGMVGITHYGVLDWTLGAPSPEQFTHIAWVGSAQGVELYVSGAHVGHLDQRLPLSRHVIGCGHLVESGPNANDAMVGWIDELAVYDRALSSQEIATHYQAMDATASGVVREPAGVMENDRDADGDSLTAQLVSATTHGRLFLNANGGFRYLPNTDFNGTDQFTYRVNDGTQNSNVATVTIHVTSVNDAPKANNDGEYDAAKATPLVVAAASGVLANDLDVDGDPLTAKLVTSPLHGLIDLHADGSFVYTPNPGAIGRDTFTYEVTDGTSTSNTAQVRLRIVRGESPTPAVDDTYTVEEDGTLVIDSSPWLSRLSLPLKATSIAYDPAGDRLFASIPPDGGPRANTLTEMNPYTGELGISLPLPGSLGNIVISDDGSHLYVGVEDGRAVQIVDLATMTLEKTIVTAPYYAGHMLPVPGTSDELALVTWNLGIHQPAGNYIYKDGVPLPNPGAGTVLAFDETGEHMYGYENWLTSFYFWTQEVQDDGLHVTQEYPWGSMLSGFIDGFQYAQGHLFVTGYAGGIVDVATQQGVGNFEGGWIFQAVSAENTLYTFDDVQQKFFTYDLTTLEKRAAIATPGIGAVRHVLTRFGNDGVALFDGQTVTLVRSDQLFGITQRGVLRNDNLMGKPTPTVTLTQDASHGELQLHSDGTFQYQPATDYHGFDHFAYSFVDGNGAVQTATVNLTITAVNDAPVAFDDRYVLPNSGSLAVTAANGVLANDSDPADGDALAAILVKGPSHGTLSLRGDGSFTYTPKASFVLSDQFTYQASDGVGRSETRSVVIRLNVPTIDVGSHILKANTPNQRIDLLVSGGQSVAGLDLYVQIGDGGPEITSLGLPAGHDGPAITHVELKQNTIFGGVPDAGTDLGSLSQVANWSISVTDGGGVTADGLLATLVVDTTGFFEGEWDLRLVNVLPNYNLGPLDSRFAAMLAFVTNGSIAVVPAEIIDRHVFYNHSSFDGDDVAVNAGDDRAIAADKIALLPGQTATYANYTNYSRGINGVMIDVRGLPSDRELSLDDFELRTGRQSTIGSWTAAPTPLLSVRRGAGSEGSDRITLAWPDHAIENAWLQVRMKSGLGTLLGHDDVFYFGNAIGETGTTPNNSFVTSIDVIGARDHQRGPFDLAAIDNIYDFNRDRLVSSIDVILARDHQSGALNSLPLITAPSLPLAALALSSVEPTPVRPAPVLGDVNKDGIFDSSDLVIVFQRGMYERASDAKDAIWADGDWDGDGKFDHNDLMAAFQASDFLKTRS